MKLIVGLLKPATGDIRLFDTNWKDHRNEILHKIGALIGKAPMYENLSARENLQLNASWYGLKPADIQRAIELTGLEISGRKRVGQFSTGMKQRLGIALAILHNPELILLDEPMNGLDPTMRNELKKIIATLQQEGKTILISSHELSEVEKICTHVAIIKKGVCAYQGSIYSVFENQPRTVYIRCNHPEKLAAICAELGYTRHQDQSINIGSDGDFARLIKHITQQDLDILGIETKLSGLDHFFEAHPI
jgi:ABC-type multidrug transport system ATPase subunit